MNLTISEIMFFDCSNALQADLFRAFDERLDAH